MSFSGGEPREERMTLTQAFELGDDRDDERAVRAAALLLEWASEAGNTKVDGILAMGISRALYLAADKSREQCERAKLDRLELERFWEAKE